MFDEFERKTKEMLIENFIDGYQAAMEVSALYMLRLLENLEDGYVTIEIEGEEEVEKVPATIENIKSAIRNHQEFFELLSKNVLETYKKENKD